MNHNMGIGYILIVNSDPTMRQTVSRYFSDHNFLTSCVSNWSELKCAGRLPSLIILDQPLGLNDGLDRLRVLAFLEAPERPLTREYLLQATRVYEDIFDRSIDVQVLRLRRKLEADPSAPRMIQTERGIGYVFALPVERF